MCSYTFSCAADVVAIFDGSSQGIGDSMSGYNGWSNFETWSIFVYFTPESKNDVDFAKDCVEEAFTDLPGFLRPFVDVSRIDWDAIYASVEQDDDEQDEPAMPTIMVCNCDEWVRDHCGVDFSQSDDETAIELAGNLTDRLADLLSAAGFEIEFPHDGKSTYHGWNGFRGFKTRWGIAGTFDAITDEQNDLVGELIAIATCAIEKQQV